MTFPDLTVTKSTVPKTKRMPKPGASFNLNYNSPLMPSSSTLPYNATPTPMTKVASGGGVGHIPVPTGNRTPAPQTSSPAANLHPVQFKAAHIPKHKGNSPGFLLQPPTVGGAHAAPGKHAAPSPGIPTANVGANAPKPFAKPASAGYNGPGIAGNLPNNGPAIPKATVGNKGGVVKASGAQPNKKKQQKPVDKIKGAAHLYNKVAHALSGGKHYTQHIKDMETTK